jgi:hypothetical protein
VIARNRWRRSFHALTLLIVSYGCLPDAAEPTPAREGALPPLKVSRNRRFLAQELPEGGLRPFFWLGDTAWNLHSLTRSEIDGYFADRAAKGFNVIMGPVFDWTGLHERSPLFLQNAYGQAPFSGLNPPRLNADLAGPEFNDYFDQIDYIVDRAAEFGLYVVLLPMWAQGINALDDNRAERARLRRIGQLLGARYRHRTNVLWMVGGEAAGESRPAAVNALAAGLERGHGGRNLMTVHPSGGRSSSSGRWRVAPRSGAYNYHRARWLDFNILQSGHRVVDRATYDLIEVDYRTMPTKPTLEGEYTYEGGFLDRPGGVAIAADQRKGAYWSVFAGGFGYTYGAVGVWQFTTDPETPVDDLYVSADDWATALQYEASSQMIYLRRLMESRPIENRIPDQSLILQGAGGAGDGAGDHVAATRDRAPTTARATYIMLYLPLPRSVLLDTSIIASRSLRVWWYDPRTGASELAEDGLVNTGTVELTPHPEGSDWVVVVDDATVGYPAPGAGSDSDL